VNTTKTIVIEKRGGSREPFSAAKLRRVLALAMQESQIDPKLADPLVQAVEVHLRYWDDERPPTSEYVFRCVCAVLKQTDLTEVADILLAHRRWRRVRRRSVRVLRAKPKRGSRPWKKRDLIAQLEGRFGIGRSAARIIASEMEQRVLNLGFRLVSQPLLDELLQNELMAWGLCDCESARATSWSE
jgi:transcriptional regulator NrdR family protein